MKKMLLTLGVLSGLALPASAQDDPSPGDRVEITFASGATIGGTLVKPQTPPREPSLTLDLTWEYPGLNGTLTVPTKDIRALRKLQGIDEATKRRLIELKRQMAETPAKPEKPKAAAPTPETPKPEPAPDLQAVEELKKAREFYAKFPPPDWSAERRNAIRQKKFRGQVPTPLEREFEAGFELWEKGRDAK